MSKREEYNEPLGMDLVDATPNYSITPEEDRKEYRERFKKVYGKYPNEIKE